MKVIVAQTNLNKLTEKTSHPHAGLAYLGAYALHKGHKTMAVDAKYEGIDNAEVLWRILAFRPDVLGLTARTPDIREAGKLAKAVKERLPGTKIIVGGAHVGGLQERVLSECGDFDVAVVGEGEITFSELLDYYGRGVGTLSGIKGIIYRENGAIRKNPERPQIPDLDTLLYPAWDLFPGIHDVSLFTSRGCPYQCLFCQRIMGNRVRTMSPERVLREIRHDIDTYGARFFQIEDEVFGLNKAWVSRTLELMLQTGIHKKVSWFANSRVNIADFDVYRKMKEAGCVGLGFGIESGNQEVLNRVQKGITLLKAEEAIAMAKKARLQTHAFFILGHPHETSRTIRDTINFAVKLNPTKVSFGVMVPYPGTKIHEMARKGEGSYLSFHEDWENYTKYFGKGLELVGLSSKALDRYQKLAYLEFHLRNFRIGGLFELMQKYIENNPRLKVKQ